MARLKSGVQGGEPAWPGLLHDSQLHQCHVSPVRFWHAVSEYRLHSISAAPRVEVQGEFLYCDLLWNSKNEGVIRNVHTEQLYVDVQDAIESRISKAVEAAEARAPERS